MYKLVLLLILAFSFSACGPQGSRDGRYFTEVNDPLDPIVGGKVVPAGSRQASYVAMIYGETVEGKPFICTGSFISNSVLVTAAHCVVDDLSKLTLAYSVNPFTDEEVRSLPVQSIVRHPAYKKGASVPSERNDIALIKFSGGLPPGAKTLALPSLNGAMNFQNVIALGYGRTEGREDTEKPDSQIGILRAVKMSVQDLIIENKALVASQKNNKGVCSGDSGGPLIQVNSAKAELSESAMILVGIASGISDAVEGDRSDSCQQNSIFMNVQAYLPWIQKNLY